MPVFAQVAHEIDIFFSFSWRDWSASIIPGSIFAVGAMRGLTLPLTTLVARYIFLVTWLTPYIYFFTLLNQVTSVDEDMINKPNRPIPSGKVTLQGAQRRSIAAFSVFLGVALYEPSLLPETLCWISTTAFLCLTSYGNHWFGKNCIAMATGAWALLSASWKAISPSTPTSDTRIYAMCGWAALTTHIQDLRDVKGDAAVGRMTLPLVFGDMGSRFIITFLALPAACCILSLGGIFQLSPITLGSLHAILGHRVLRQAGSRYDHKTYMFYTYIFCFILMLSSMDSHGLI
uniref:Polyprenyl transferase eriF n=1 Tax=Hericium erinaceus TaxID=91752 RepID=ERIF_HERER|nr:RecName: Full=Polyprenyl transferase eriF; AltName: Full=Erinacine biosynthesis cluster protein F [Hericium erinaceus]ARE72243.1 UbiA prenyltransferase [Hericium erinaceus]